MRMKAISVSLILCWGITGRYVRILLVTARSCVGCTCWSRVILPSPQQWELSRHPWIILDATIGELLVSVRCVSFWELWRELYFGSSKQNFDVDASGCVYTVEPLVCQESQCSSTGIQSSFRQLLHAAGSWNSALLSGGDTCGYRTSLSWRGSLATMDLADRDADGRSLRAFLSFRTPGMVPRPCQRRWHGESSLARYAARQPSWTVKSPISNHSEVYGRAAATRRAPSCI
jgi:hypothetical protein